MEASQKPFPEALRDLLDEQELSIRALARKTKQKGWGNPGTVSYLMRGEQKPSMRGMEKIAQALQVPPEHFAEYRMALARRELDPETVGFDTALRNLNRK